MPIQNKRDRNAAKISAYANSLKPADLTLSVTLTLDEIAEIMAMVDVSVKTQDMIAEYTPENIEAVKPCYYTAARAVYRSKTKSY